MRALKEALQLALLMAVVIWGVLLVALADTQKPVVLCWPVAGAGWALNWVAARMSTDGMTADRVRQWVWSTDRTCLSTGYAWFNGHPTIEGAR